jgi:hypothetical protein
MPKPPPSDFCSNTVAINVATIIKWMTIMTVCISTFRRKPMLHPTAGLVLRELNLAACYTIARGIVTPDSPVFAALVEWI